jgi:glycosyltransferase involved in cell wall biosynthesis
MDLSIVIPVYNERGNVTILANRIKETIPKNLSYEILFVDDGSKDGTYEELMKLSGELRPDCCNGRRV